MEASDRREARVSDLYEELRPLMFSIAYRMLGTASEAEDIVQEAFLRFHRESAEGDRDRRRRRRTCRRSRRGSASTTSARRACAGSATSAPGCPNRCSPTPAPDVAQHAETADSLSMAFLVLLESLSPVERAVFLLREVFDYGYDEIATDRGQERGQLSPDRGARASSGRGEAAAVRGLTRCDGTSSRGASSRRSPRATSTGSSSLLAEDVVAYGDGGGTAPAFPRPVYGRERIARLLLGPAAQRNRERLAVAGMRSVAINGQPGAVFLDPEGRPVAVVTLDIADDLVQTVRVVSNPDKLRHLGANVGPAGPAAIRR